MRKGIYWHCSAHHCQLRRYCTSGRNDRRTASLGSSNLAVSLDQLQIPPSAIFDINKREAKKEECAHNGGFSLRITDSSFGFDTSDNNLIPPPRPRTRCDDISLPESLDYPFPRGLDDDRNTVAGSVIPFDASFSPGSVQSLS